jgi:hypothetical protein
MALYSLQFPGEQLTEHKLFPNLNARLETSQLHRHMRS